MAKFQVENRKLDSEGHQLHCSDCYNLYNESEDRVVGVVKVDDQEIPVCLAHALERFGFFLLLP